MLQVTNVSFAYEPNVFILQNISFETKKRIINICGNYGQGVTTLLKCISGLLPCESMQCICDENHLENLSAKDKNISLLLHRLEFFDRKTVAFNLQYQLKIHQISQSLEQCLQNMPMDIRGLLETKVTKLTEQEKFKVALVRALLKKPRVLIIDDADTFLTVLHDEKEFEKVIDYIHAYGGKVILGSHTPIVYTNRCVDMFYLENGSLHKRVYKQCALQNIKTLHEFAVFWGKDFTSVDLLYENGCWYNMKKNIACFLPNASNEDLSQDVVVFVEHEELLKNISFLQLQKLMREKKAFLFSKIMGDRIFL